jgi:hypothetical protein
MHLNPMRIGITLDFDRYHLASPRAKVRGVTPGAENSEPVTEGFNPTAGNLTIEESPN